MPASNIPLVETRHGQTLINYHGSVLATVNAGSVVEAALMANALVPTYEPVEVVYRNWEGKQARRLIVPRRWRYGTEEPWHKEPGWLLEAYDLEKGAERTFAEKGFISRFETVEAGAPGTEPWMFRSPERIVADHARALADNEVWEADGVTHGVFYIEDYLAAGGPRLGPVGDWYVAVVGKPLDEIETPEDLTERRQVQLSIGASWNEDTTEVSFPDDVLTRIPDGYRVFVIVELERPL